MAKITNRTVARKQARLNVAKADATITELKAKLLATPHSDPVKRADYELKITMAMQTRQSAGRILRPRKKKE